MDISVMRRARRVSSRVTEQQVTRTVSNAWRENGNNRGPISMITSARFANESLGFH
jgi:hypothetical protein